MSRPGTTAVVELQNVHKSYASGKTERKVLIHANLTVNQGEFVVLYGPSGSGKTTLLNLIGALDTADSGQVWVDGMNLTHLRNSGMAAFRREKVGFVFQFFNLVSNLTALDNVELGLEAVGMKRIDIRARAMKYLEKAGLKDQAHAFAEELSEGEQQRVAIARALAKEPRLLLADEPTGNLDEANAMKISDFMAALHKETGTTFVVVTHNQSLAQIADKVYYLSRGRLMGV